MASIFDVLKKPLPNNYKLPAGNLNAAQQNLANQGYGNITENTNVYTDADGIQHINNNNPAYNQAGYNNSVATGDSQGQQAFSSALNDDQQAADLSIQQYIKEMQDALRQSRISALDKARQNALGNLDTEAAGIAPGYYDKRNQVAAASDVGAMNFAQYMAARGIKGNAGAMPEIYRNNALQGNIGALNRQEQAANDTIARSRTGIQNAYESDVVGANADIDAQGLQAYINQMNADRAYNLQFGEAVGNIGGTQTLAAKNAATQANQWNTTNSQQQEQNKLDNLYRQRVFDYNVSRDAVADSQWQKTMNLDLRRQTFTEAQGKIENAYRNSQISQQEKDRALQWAKFNAESDPTSLDNKYKQAQLDQTLAETTNLQNGLTASGGQPAGGPTQSETVNYWTSSSITQLDPLPTAGRKAWLKSHKAEIVQNAGLDAFNGLMGLYSIYSLD